MSIKTEPELDAPIAGMALTHELGARPWQSPPQFPTIDTAVLVNPIITEYIKGLADTAGIEYTMDAQESYIDMDVTESDLNRVEQDLLKDGMLTRDVVEDLKEDVTQDIPKMGLMSRKPVEEEVE